MKSWLTIPVLDASFVWLLRTDRFRQDAGIEQRHRRIEMRPVYPLPRELFFVLAYQHAQRWKSGGRCRSTLQTATGDVHPVT
jgi:hypothetical protein